MAFIESEVQAESNHQERGKYSSACDNMYGSVQNSIASACGSRADTTTLDHQRVDPQLGHESINKCLQLHCPWRRTRPTKGELSRKRLLLLVC